MTGNEVIPYSCQAIDDDDIDAVVRVLRSPRLTCGPAVESFEAALAARVEVKHAIAFANGTAALHGALAAARIGAGDRVVTSPLSFAASATCALYVGARVSFVDIDPDTLNLDVAAVPACDALVAVHYAGLPADLRLLRHRPRVVVEDACHALGARTPDGPVGNCARSDMTVFSFHPVKAITTGEGGAVTTNSDPLADALRRFRSHGTVPTPEHGGWAYEIDSLGFNYRLTDIHAALGESQLAKLGTFVALRNALADRYRAALADVPGLLLPPAAPSLAGGWRHAYHLFAVRVPNRRDVYDALHAAGIAVQVHYVPIHRHPLYAEMGFTPDQFPHTERAYAGLLSLPLFPTLTRSDQDRVIDTLKTVLARAPEEVPA
jgi:dTDP-4-amino-4,6-dideoxygalactose transaminase